MSPAGPSRRAVLSGGGVLLLGALGGCWGDGDASPQQPTEYEREVRRRRRLARDSDELFERYAAVVERFPSRLADLEPWAEEHRAHARALRGQPPKLEGSASGPAGEARESFQFPAVPASWPAARAQLAEVERAASRRRRRQALDAEPELARLLASIAACNAVHAVLLESLAAGGRT